MISYGSLVIIHFFFEVVFSPAFTGFICLPQQTRSQAVQPHESSTTTTSPQSSHLYFSPFFAIYPHILD